MFNTKLTNLTHMSVNRLNNKTNSIHHKQLHVDSVIYLIFKGKKMNLILKFAEAKDKSQTCEGYMINLCINKQTYEY